MAQQSQQQQNNQKKFSGPNYGQSNKSRKVTISKDMPNTTYDTASQFEENVSVPTLNQTGPFNDNTSGLVSDQYEQFPQVNQSQTDDAINDEDREAMNIQYYSDMNQSTPFLAVANRVPVITYNQDLEQFDNPQKIAFGGPLKPQGQPQPNLMNYPSSSKQGSRWRKQTADQNKRPNNAHHSHTASKDYQNRHKSESNSQYDDGNTSNGKGVSRKHRTPQKLSGVKVANRLTSTADGKQNNWKENMRKRNILINNTYKNASIGGTIQSNPQTRVNNDNNLQAKHMQSVKMNNVNSTHFPLLTATAHSSERYPPQQPPVNMSIHNQSTALTNQQTSNGTGQKQSMIELSPQQQAKLTSRQKNQIQQRCNAYGQPMMFMSSQKDDPLLDPQLGLASTFLLTSQVINEQPQQQQTDKNSQIKQVNSSQLPNIQQTPILPNKGISFQESMAQYNTISKYASKTSGQQYQRQSNGPGTHKHNHTYSMDIYDLIQDAAKKKQKSKKRKQQSHNIQKTDEKKITHIGAITSNEEQINNRNQASNDYGQNNNNNILKVQPTFKEDLEIIQKQQEQMNQYQNGGLTEQVSQKRQLAQQQQNILNFSVVTSTAAARQSQTAIKQSPVNESLVHKSIDSIHSFNKPIKSAIKTTNESYQSKQKRQGGATATQPSVSMVSQQNRSSVDRTKYSKQQTASQNSIKKDTSTNSHFKSIEKPILDPPYFGIHVERKHVERLAKKDIDEESRLEVIYRILKDSLRKYKDKLIEMKQSKVKEQKKLIELRKQIKLAAQEKDQGKPFKFYGCQEKLSDEIKTLLEHLLNDDKKRHYKYCPCCKNYEVEERLTQEQMDEFLEWIKKEHERFEGTGKKKNVKPRDKTLQYDSVSDITDLSKEGILNTSADKLTKAQRAKLEKYEKKLRLVSKSNVKKHDCLNLNLQRQNSDKIVGLNQRMPVYMELKAHSDREYSDAAISVQHFEANEMGLQTTIPEIQDNQAQTCPAEYATAQQQVDAVDLIEFKEQCIQAELDVQAKVHDKNCGTDPIKFPANRLLTTRDWFYSDLYRLMLRQYYAKHNQKLPPEIERQFAEHEKKKPIYHPMEPDSPDKQDVGVQFENMQEAPMSPKYTPKQLSENEINYLLTVYKNRTVKFADQEELERVHADTTYTAKLITKTLVEGQVPLLNIIEKYQDVSKGNVRALLYRCLKLYEAKESVHKIFLQLIKKQQDDQMFEQLQIGGIKRIAEEKKESFILMANNRRETLKRIITLLEQFVHNNRIYQGTFMFNKINLLEFCNQELSTVLDVMAKEGIPHRKVNQPSKLALKKILEKSDSQLKHMTTEERRTSNGGVSEHNQDGNDMTPELRRETSTEQILRVAKESLNRVSMSPRSIQNDEHENLLENQTQKQQNSNQNSARNKVVNDQMDNMQEVLNLTIQPDQFKQKPIQNRNEKPIQQQSKNQQQQPQKKSSKQQSSTIDYCQCPENNTKALGNIKKSAKSTGRQKENSAYTTPRNQLNSQRGSEKLQKSEPPIRQKEKEVVKQPPNIVHEKQKSRNGNNSQLGSNSTAKQYKNGSYVKASQERTKTYAPHKELLSETSSLHNKSPSSGNAPTQIRFQDVRIQEKVSKGSFVTGSTQKANSKIKEIKSQHPVFLGEFQNKQGKNGKKTGNGANQQKRTSSSLQKNKQKKK